MKRFKVGDVVVITKPPIDNWSHALKPESIINLVGEIGIVFSIKLGFHDRVLCIYNNPFSFVEYSAIKTKYIEKIGVL